MAQIGGTSSCPRSGCWWGAAAMDARGVWGISVILPWMTTRHEACEGSKALRNMSACELSQCCFKLCQWRGIRSALAVSWNQQDPRSNECIASTSVNMCQHSFSLVMFASLFIDFFWLPGACWRWSHSHLISRSCGGVAFASTMSQAPEDVQHCTTQEDDNCSGNMWIQDIRSLWQLHLNSRYRIYPASAHGAHGLARKDIWAQLPQYALDTAAPSHLYTNIYTYTLRGCCHPSVRTFLIYLFHTVALYPPGHRPTASGLTE